MRYTYQKGKDVPRILVAGDEPDGDAVLLECIAHEYVHRIQNIQNRPYDEAEAEKCVFSIVRTARLWLQVQGPLRKLGGTGK